MGIKDDKYLNPDAGVEYTLSPEYARPMEAKPDKWNNLQWSWGVTVLSETRQQGGKAVVTQINKKVYWYMKARAYDMVCEAELVGGCKCFLSVMPETMEKDGKIIKFNKFCLVYNDKPFYSHPTSPEANSTPQETEQAPPLEEEYPEEVKPEETTLGEPTRAPDKPPPENEYGILNARADLLEACVGKAVKIVEPYNATTDTADPNQQPLIEFDSTNTASLAISLMIQVCSEQYEKLGFKR